MQRTATSGSTSSEGFDLNVKTEWEREVSGASNTSVLTFTNRGEIKESTGDESQQHKTKSKGIATEYFKRSETDADSFTLKGKVFAQSEKSVALTVCQGFSRKILRNKMFAHFMVVIVVMDAFLTATDIDFRARGETPPGLVLGLSTMCLSLYALELLFQVFARGRRVLHDWLAWMDLIIIVSGCVDLLVSAFVKIEFLSKIGAMRVLRLIRIVRLLQLLRRNRSLKELQKLVNMLATCLKTLLWSFVFLCLVMTGWAMLMVEIIHPYVLELHEVFSDCEQCMRATSTVMQANLLLFKTVIAGDSWGQIAVPIIESHPETSIIFVGSLLTLVFGVLNLIVAVVVDTFAEVRENDVVNLAQELEFNIEDDQKILRQIFHRIDADEDGELTLDELLDGAHHDSEFQSRLKVMDIDEVDLQQLFEMIDADGSGSIAVEEFIVPLSRWVHDSKTAPRFIKYNLLRAMTQQEELLRFSHQNFNSMFERVDRMSLVLNNLAAKHGCATKPSKSTAAFNEGATKDPVSAEKQLGHKADEEKVSPDAHSLEQPHASILSPQLNNLKGDMETALEAALLVLDASFRDAADALKQSQSVVESQLGLLAESVTGANRSQSVQTRREAPETSHEVGDRSPPDRPASELACAGKPPARQHADVSRDPDWKRKEKPEKAYGQQQQRTI
ncbi:CAC [Symbiodinium sp. CCMP2592]|nr:CAC [Symbiodinium sp. CCMP2592]